MKRLIKSVTSLFPVLLYACVTSGTPETAIPPTPSPEQVHQPELTTDTLVMNTWPQNGKFLLAALSPRLRFEKDEIRFAMGNAARQMSIYRGAEVRYARIMDENIIGTVQDQKIEIIYDKNYALSLLSSLKIESEVRDTDHFTALISLEGSDIPIYPPVPNTPGLRPEWTMKTPEDKDYLYGVGISARLKTPYESWEQSDKQAMAEIASYLNTGIYAGSATIERSGTSTSASTGVTKSLNWSDVKIKGLYILSRWREPDGSSYYSLAIVKKP